jgi:hypothetical protein
MTATHRRLAGVAAAAGALLACTGAVAATASAATITVDKPCYVNTVSGPAQMTISGSGFNPGDSVDIEGGTTYASATVNQTGDFVTAATAAPELTTGGPGTLSTTLTATDQDFTTNTTITAQTTVLSANLAVTTKPTTVRVSQIRKKKLTFSFSGFTSGKRVYAYYLRKKKVVAKAKFGKTSGPCGTLKQKAFLFPGSHPDKNGYTVVFESTSRYAAKAFPSVSGNLSFDAL